MKLLSSIINATNNNNIDTINMLINIGCDVNDTDVDPWIKFSFKLLKNSPTGIIY